MVKKYIKKLFSMFVQPFQSRNRFDLRVVFAFLLINGLVFVNASLHDPRIGYDAGDHLRYIRTLSHWRLVTPEDSREYFSPPLPYALPALLISLTRMKEIWAAKLAQYLNFCLSVGLTWYLMKTCQLMSAKPSLKLGALIFLGIFPVYYKTFAFVRGESFVVFFAVVMMYYVLLMSVKERFTVTAATILGGAMGLCALSRQWGILLFPPVFLLLVLQWIRLPRCRSAITKTFCLCVVLIFAISGWFYIFLHVKYKTSTAFNRKPAPHFSLRNQPVEFYAGISPGLLFSNPIRPNFPNQFFPIFYSELWGDYWGYFSFYGKDTRKPEFVIGYAVYRRLSQESCPEWLETNYETIGAYLGRVNLLGIFPSALVFASFCMAAIGILQKPRNDSLLIRRREIHSFLLFAIGATMAGYFWFLIMYPSPGKGDTIKATYVLHVFPFIAILGGIFLEQIKQKSRFFYRLILGGLCVIFVHNLFAMLTHYRLYHLP